MVLLSYRHVLLLLPSIVYVSGEGNGQQASATLKNKIHAVKSSCTIAIYPSNSKSRTRRNIPSDTAGRTFEFSSLPLSLFLSHAAVYIADFWQGCQDTRLEQIILNKFAIACYAQI